LLKKIILARLDFGPASPAAFAQRPTFDGIKPDQGNVGPGALARRDESRVPALCPKAPPF